MKLMMSVLFPSGQYRVYEIKQNQHLTIEAANELIEQWSEILHETFSQGANYSFKLTEQSGVVRVLNLSKGDEISFWIANENEIPFKL